MATISFFFGALLITGIVTIGFAKAVRRWNSDVPGLLSANALSLITATIIGGFGLADGSDPKFHAAFSQYAFPQLVVMILTLYGWNRSRRSAEPAALGVASGSVTRVSAPRESAISSGRLVVAAVIISAATMVAWFAVKGTWSEETTASSPVRDQKTLSQAENEVREGLLQAARDVKPTLPRKLDNVTTLVDMRVDGLDVTYENEISDSRTYQFTAFEKHLRNLVCGGGMREGIQHGASYTYQYWTPAPERRPLGSVRISSC
jgi:hypothetical protein